MSVSSSNSNILINQTRKDIVFFGNDYYAIQPLADLMKHVGKIGLTVVVSNHDNIVGTFAKKCSLKRVLWKDFKEDSEAQENSREDTYFEYYLGVTTAFGPQIPQSVIRRFENGILNVYPSFRYKYCGSDPVNRAIINGDSLAGVSIRKISGNALDGGLLYEVETVPINPYVRAPEMIKILSAIGGSLLTEVIDNLDHYSEYAVQLKFDKTLYSNKLTQELGNVNWSTKTAEEIYNLFRGLYGSYFLVTFYGSQCVELDEIGLLRVSEDEETILHPIPIAHDEPSLDTDFSTFYSSPPFWNVKSLPQNASPGHVLYQNGVLCVKCKDNSTTETDFGWLFVRKVKMNNEWMTAEDFYKKWLTSGEGTFEFLPGTTPV